MKFMQVNSDQAWYYGKVGECFPVVKITQDMMFWGIENVVHSYDGDRKPGKPFGDKMELLLCDSDVSIIEYDLKQAKFEMLEALESENVKEMKKLIMIMECIKLSEEA